MRLLLRVAALAAIAAISAVNLAETMRPLLPLWNGEADFVTPSEKRFEPLRRILPAAGEIGYMSDQFPGDANQATDAVRKYYLMQYALTPRVLVRTADRPVTVGDFNGSINAIAPAAFTAQDLGQGLVVIELKDR